MKTKQRGTELEWRGAWGQRKSRLFLGEVVAQWARYKLDEAGKDQTLHMQGGERNVVNRTKRIDARSSREAKSKSEASKEKSMFGQGLQHALVPRSRYRFDPCCRHCVQVAGEAVLDSLSSHSAYGQFDD